LLILAILAVIPYWLPKPATSELGRWFPRSNRLAQGVLVTIALAIIILTLMSLVPADAY
jgi:hypothetical protein